MPGGAATDGLKLPTGYRLRQHETLDSTNDEARRQAVQGAPDGTVVIAKRQTSGRGRRGRDWASPMGNLYASLLLRPDYEPQEAAQLSFVTALAVAKTVGEVLPAHKRIELKWPNDVLVEGRKISGILLESALAGNGQLDWIIIGCGINIASHPKLALGEATSLAAEGARPVTPDDVLESLVGAIHEGIAGWETNGFAPVREAWLSLARGVGGSIEVRLPGETLQGTFKNLDASGALELQQQDGTCRTVTGGEVYFGEPGQAGLTAESA